MTVTYLANEGVMLDDGERVVLIDALFREGVAGYAVHSPALRDSLERARPPFDRVTAVLVTHRHDDHFDPASVMRFLAHNPRATVLAGADVVAPLTAFSDPVELIERRVRTASPDWMGTVRRVVGGIPVTALGLRHGYRHNYGLDHRGYVVEIAGLRVLHLGDLEVIPENIDPFQFPGMDIDVALVPYWMLLDGEGRERVRSGIAARHVLAFHIEPGRAAAIARRLATLYPEAVPLIEPGRQWRLGRGR